MNRLIAIAVSLLWASHAAATTLDDARHLFMTGRYDEALDAYNQLVAAQPREAVLGSARSLAAVGKLDEARQRLSGALDWLPNEAALHAELAVLAWQQGRAEDAERYADAALRLDENALSARWVRAEMLRTSGKLAEADAAYRWFVDYYNAHGETASADEIVWIGRAAAQYARWNRQTDQFTQLVNRTFPSAVRRDADCWPAHLEIARLFLEKYNQADAAAALADAAQINPHAPDVLATQAELALLDFQLAKAERLLARALRINPRHLPSLLVLADLEFVRLDPSTAHALLDDAAQINPRDERVAGRRVAALRLLDEVPNADDSHTARAEAMVAEVTDRNSHAGEFFEALASALELSRKYPDAADALELAVQVMPRQVGPRGKLGLIEMRLGDETAARRTLEAAFAIDPFNVRVHNSLAVLDVLDNYATLETEHFRFRYDPAHDEILARCAARYLEEIYPELCRQLGAELSRPGLVEIFNRAENTDGQGWFSARIVGLPNVHLVAACTGRMVAVTSPAAIRQRVDWARVLRHELVHLINLDQTNFNVPHWFTEAVAVRLEDAPRRPEWHEMLVRRVARGELFHLDTINGAFVHPGSAENWQMAYCQADLYAEYLLETYGDDALRKMLAAYRTTRSTDRVLRDCFNVEQDDFEHGYAEFLQRLVTEWQTEGVRASRSFAELNRAYEQNPTDAGAAIDLAAAHVDRKQFAQARQLVDAVLADDPHHTGASAVKGRLLMAAGETAAARALLDGVLDRDAPHAEVLRLVSQLELRHGSREAAGRLLQLGAKRWPRDPAWTKSLTVVALENGDRQPLPGLLERIAESDPLDPKLRQKLALLAAADEDHTAAGRWAWEAIGLNVNDAAMHRLRARALLQSGDTDGAQFHNSIADQLDKPLNFFRQ